jgi:acyl-CoA synthetase (NDP forming)
MTTLPAPVRAALERARAEGRHHLYETEALTLAAAMGLAIPSHLVVPDGASVLRFDLGMLIGDRVVVKAMSPTVTHKTEAGGVRVVDKDPAAISRAVDAVAAAVPDSVAFLVAEYVEHPPAPAGEVLLGMRWSDEFGPVVVFGLGGVNAEFLAGIAPEAATAVFSPALREGVAGALRRCAATAPVLDGFRGTPPAFDEPGLVALLARALGLAAALVPDQVVEFEVNPLAFTSRGPMALDARCRVGPPPALPARPPIPADAVERLLRPDRIAVVGVSDRVNLGRVILRNVLGTGFPAGRLTVVKPGRDAIDGVRCVPDLAAAGPVDLLVVAVGADQAPGLVEEACAGSSVRSVVLIPGGLGEREGSEGHAERIAAALGGAPAPRPVVVGGNCMGVRSIPGGYDTTFIPGHKASPRGRSGRHPVAVISQSGAFVLSRLDRLPWLDPAYVVTLGNQVDLAVGDLLEHFATDESVRVAACYVEGFRPGDGLRWLEAAARFRERGGTVVLYRGGRTVEGARSASSHTASVAGDTRVTAALAAQAGVLVASSVSDFEDLLRLAVLLGDRPVGGARLGAVSNAGFEAVAVADNLGGLELATLSAGTRARIEALLFGEGLDAVVAAGNPLDLTPTCGAAAYADAVAAMLDEPGVEVGLVGCVPFTPALDTLPAADGHGEDLASPGSLGSRLVRLWGSSTKPWVAVVDGGDRFDPMAAMLEEGGIPVFRRADAAVRMLGSFVDARLR